MTTESPSKRVVVGKEVLRRSRTGRGMPVAVHAVGHLDGLPGDHLVTICGMRYPRERTREPFYFDHPCQRCAPWTGDAP